MSYLTYRLGLKNGTSSKTEKERRPIAKVSEKKKQQDKDNKPKADEQAEWYIMQVDRQTGTCINCGGSTKSSLYVYRKACVGHVLPKRPGMFPSVATHEENAMEICTINGCHQQYDKSWESAAKMPCWPIAVAKFKIILPSIAPEERKNIPDVLWQEVES